MRSLALLLLAACAGPPPPHPASNTASASTPSVDAAPPQHCWSSPTLGAHCYTTDVACEDNARLAALMNQLEAAPTCH